MIAVFWISLFIVFYAFAGYGILLFILIKIKRAVKGKPTLPDAQNLPTCTLVVAAYNEERFMPKKYRTVSN
jgi:biofilm PGA synthesis N-glycosyltransferase PgaC